MLPQCGAGEKRIAGKCVDIPPATPPDHGSGSGPSHDRCFGGTMRRGVCQCPPPSVPKQISQRSYRCVTPPCPDGTRRKGRLCISLDGTNPPPPPSGPRCSEGSHLHNGGCRRIVETACPDGTHRSDGRCAGLPPPSASPAPPVPQRATAASDADSPYEPDEVLVEIPGNSPQQVANRLIDGFGLVTLSRTRLDILGTSLYRFRIPSGRSVDDVVASLAREPGVETSQPNWRYTLDDGATAALPVDAARSAPAAERTTLPQYARELIEARKANEISRGTGILIAVIDTGIEEDHPEIAGSIASRFNTFPSQAIVPDTHATAIASIIAAKRELAGIAPDARILSVQAFTPTTDKPSASGQPAAVPRQRDGGRGTSQRIVTGLDWSLMRGARIVNMSFSGPPLDVLASKMIAKGVEAGVIFVAAAGNGGPSAPPAYPAADPAVVAVTAIDDRKSLYTHANIGPYIDVAAPGVDVMAAAIGGTYDLASGTSFAAAHVSAVIALVLDQSPGLGRDRIVARVKEAALDLGPPGADDRFGAGCINALRALLGVAVETSGSQQ